jgi:hypothetical protein
VPRSRAGPTRPAEGPEPGIWYGIRRKYGVIIWPAPRNVAPKEMAFGVLEKLRRRGRGTVRYCTCTVLHSTVLYQHTSISISRSDRSAGCHAMTVLAQSPQLLHYRMPSEALLDNSHRKAGNYCHHVQSGIAGYRCPALTIAWLTQRHSAGVSQVTRLCFVAWRNALILPGPQKPGQKGPSWLCSRGPGESSTHTEDSIAPHRPAV